MSEKTLNDFVDERIQGLKDLRHKKSELADVKAEVKTIEANLEAIDKCMKELVEK